MQRSGKYERIDETQSNPIGHQTMENKGRTL